MTAKALKDAGFLADAFVRRVLELLGGDGEEAHVIGGAVRNALMGLPSSTDIDIATTALPEIVMARAEAAGIRAVPTGIEHGTVTLIGPERVLEVTTLRQDIATDGRHAVVRFGRDWTADALRRDFTMNALSVDRDGRLFDPVGGAEDIVARRVRFIGDAAQRIAEDRLRVLRFFRFHAIYGAGPLDAEGLSASVRARYELSSLSAERIGQEMRKLIVAPRAAETVAAMQESGILPLLAAGVGDLAALARAQASLAEPSPALRFVALFAWVQEDIDRIVRRFRLGNHERDRMSLALAAAYAVRGVEENGDRPLIYRLGKPAFFDGLAVAGAKGFLPADIAARRKVMAEAWTVPEFPLSGRDVAETGIGRGPAVGVLLRHLEKWWIGEGFRPARDELLRRLQNIVASQQ